MFKKILFLLSIVLGLFLFLSISSSKKKRYFLKKDINDKPILEIEKERVVEEKLLPNLNNRQKDIYKLLEEKKVLLPSDIYSLHPNVSTRTLRRDMTGLVDLNLVRQEGSTRDTRYFLIS